MDRSVWLASYPAGIPSEITIPNESVPSMLEKAVRKFPDRPAIVFALRPGVHKTRTFAQLWADIESFAGGLSERGFVRGDRLALFLPNCPQYVIAYFAALRLGLTVVQVSPLYIGDDLVKPLLDSRAKGIVTLDIFSHELEAVWGRLPDPKPKVFLGRLKEEAPFLVGLLFLNGILRKKGLDPSLPRKIPFEPFPKVLKSRTQAPAVTIDPAKDVAAFQYTGGTTGKPKAAMLTHRNLVANVLQLREWDRKAQEGKEVVLSVIPLFHVYGMTVAMNYPLFYGATMIVNPDKPEPKMALELISRYHVTEFPGVPALYNLVNNHPIATQVDLKSVRMCLSGSAPLTVEITKKFEALTGGRLIEGYGLSETSPVTHANPLEGNRKVGSIGVPVPSTEMKIVGPDDPSKELGVDEVGELAVRGPQVMLGYWNQPEETAMVLKDGWFLTGDLARVDAEGFTYIVDRKKDMILVGGFNVYPREVEEVLYQHPDVLEAAVVGVADERSGESVKAFVVRKPGTNPQALDIIEFVRSRIAHFKAPRSVEFVESLPKTMVGKVLRRELKKQPSLSPPTK